MMLSRLKLSSISDEKAKEMIQSWVTDWRSFSKGHLNQLIKWFDEKGLNKDFPKVVYRGIKYDYVSFSKVLGKREWDIKKSTYDSWSVDPKIADRFSSVRNYGFILSKEIKNDIFLDVNRVYKYFDIQNPFIQRM